MSNGDDNLLCPTGDGKGWNRLLRSFDGDIEEKKMSRELPGDGKPPWFDWTSKETNAGEWNRWWQCSMIYLIRRKDWMDFVYCQIRLFPTTKHLSNIDVVTNKERERERRTYCPVWKIFDWSVSMEKMRWSVGRSSRSSWWVVSKRSFVHVAVCPRYWKRAAAGNSRDSCAYQAWSEQTECRLECSRLVWVGEVVSMLLVLQLRILCFSVDHDWRRWSISPDVSKRCRSNRWHFR